MPPLVENLLVFFYLLTWGNLLFLIYQAIAEAQNGDYRFLLPAGLYMAFLVGFLLFNLWRSRRLGGDLPDILWGHCEPAALPYIFLGVSFVLVAWMTSLSPTLGATYFPLLAITLGMLPWRSGLPFVALQIGTLLWQWQVIDAILSNQLPLDTLLSIAFSVLVFVAYAITITALLRSRINSEMLVRELQATKRQLEEALAQEKEVAVLRERTRMAREMHDGLGHALSLVAVKIEVAQRLQAVDPARAAAELEATKELVRHSMADLRASLADLRNPAFEADGQPLAPALEAWATRTAQEGGIALTCRFEPGAEVLPAPIQDALWRVGREAILNVVKHARARQAELNVFGKDGAIYLSVADDGVGIPHLADGTARLEIAGHYGLRGMRERLEALGGQLTIRPVREGRGTLVLASLPLPPAAPPPPQRLRDRLSPGAALFGKRET